MRKFMLLMAVMLLLTMTACSEGTTKSKDVYTPEEAAKDGHVVVQQLSNSIQEVLDGAVNNKNLTKMFAFIGKVQSGKKSKMKVTIFNENGSYATNTISFDGEKIHYDNNYKGYDGPVGEFICLGTGNISLGTYQIGTCKKEDSKGSVKYYTFLAVIGTVSAFREAEAKAG